MNLVVVLLLVSLFFSGFSMVVANVLLIGSNITVSFDDKEANFSPLIKGSGFSGVLYVADPLDACSVLTNKVEQATNASSPVLLIIRGECSFENKVRRAQKAGFKAAIVYDNKDGDTLISMSGNSGGIKIHALFVSKATGEELMKYTGNTDMELWLTPSFVNSVWSVMAISFISLLAMFAMLATCFFVRRHRIRREQPRSSCVREFHGMSNRLVKAMPSLIFTAVLEDNCTSRTCAICLEDYSVGEKLRILPCCHKFHAFCVDSWLTSWRTFCPVCKRDARISTGDAPASESTPLLSYSSAASIASSSMLSSVRSSLASPAMHMALALYQSASVSGTSNLQQSFRSYGQTPPLSINRSSIDLQNASSQRYRAPYLVSAHSLGYPSLSPLNLRYLSPYIPSPSNASSIYLSSSSYQQHPLRCSESAASFSPFNSSHSLPDC